MDSDRELFLESYFEVLGLAESMLSSKQNPKETETFSNVNSFHTNQNVKIKLPTIKLPTFDGTFTLWREYSDAFNALIHSNDSLSDVQKLSYLKSSLKDEPADLLRSYETTSENYTIAWTALQKDIITKGV